MLPLNPSERRALRARAHHIDPVVLMGAGGLSAAVLKEIDICLNSHELIKVKAASDQREEREAMMAAICAQLHAAPVQHIGRLLVIYRPKPQQKEAAKSIAKPARNKSAGKAAKVTKATKSKPSPVPQPKAAPRVRRRTV